MVADLPVQRAQRIEHAVVEVTAEDERQHHRAQALHGRMAQAVARRHDAALEPGEALPFAPLHLQVFLQGGERDGGRAGVAVGAQGQVHAEDEAVLGGFPHQGVDGLHGPPEVFLVGEAAAAAVHPGGLALVLIDVDHVDVAGHVQFARTQLAHADDPERHRPAIRALRRAMAGVQLLARVAQGFVEREFREFGRGPGDVGQRRAFLAVQPDQPLHDQLPQHAQGGARVVPERAQGLQGLGHGLAGGGARRQQRGFAGIAALQPLVESGMGGPGGMLRGGAAGLSERRGHMARKRH